MRLLLLPLPLVCSGCWMEMHLGTIVPEVPPPTEPPVLDRDGDTVAEADDCNDRDFFIKPGVAEVCDGVDNNCDELVDVEVGGSGNVCAYTAAFDQELISDILVVWDNSTDMKGTYETLAAEGLGAMVRHLVGTGSDTHIGVITTSTALPSDFGVLTVPSQYNEPHPWLSGIDPDTTWQRAYSFFEYILDEQPEGGMGNDDTARGAIARAIELSESKNSGFFRSEAPLNIVILSNEEDTGQPFNLELLSILGNFKGSYSKVRVFAVTETETSTCQYDADTAATIVSLVEQTGGFYETVCMPDWRGFLSSVGQTIATQALKDTFVLDKPAMLGTIDITIDPADGREPYLWESTFALTDAYTLVFPDAPPPAASTIVVEYEQDWRF